ncbi:MAG: hypothetical protein RLZZ416_737 [Candidatus Parcubacteria bacterium]|jgi:hypothetical protein
MPPQENIQFDTDNQSEFTRAAAPEGFDLSGKLIDWGLVTNRQQAQYALTGVLVVVLMITFYVVWTSFF